MPGIGVSRVNMPRARSLLALVLSLCLAATVVSPVAALAEEEDPQVLVFSATAGFRHGSIEAGIAAVEALGVEHGFSVTATENASNFNTEYLSDFDAVVWLSTTGDVLNAEQQAAFEGYIQDGGGYAGIHAASDTHYDWAWYGGLVGAYFQSHPPGTQDADVWVTDNAHPSTDGLPDVWNRHDEWYHFDINPRGNVHVLATLDEASYFDQVGSGYTDWMGTDHPIAWCQNYDGGRSWYTGGGHTNESFAEQPFLDHMAGGIMWAAGMVEGDCGGTIWDNYEKVVLEDDTSSLMSLKIANDGRVFYTQRAGEMFVIDPDSLEVEQIADLDVYTGAENGLLGHALDPDFDDNDRIWISYAAPDAVVGDDPYYQVSNFTLAADGTLDLASEQVVLEIPHQRDDCCHTSGSLAFGSDGNLWISTGDDTNPFDSDNYTPIDERPGREIFDAQRTSANTNDLRGKLLRITPTEDGSDYTIPAGNLFEPGAAETLPEIHTMGLRNPFTFHVDPHNPELVYLADYGPDAGSPNPNRGPEGQVTWHIIDEPQNIGWPYCKGDRPYIDYDFETGVSGDPFDCDGGPVNDSPNNTGLTQLPPVTPATVFYGYGGSDAFPMLAGGGSMAGPRYVYDPDLDSDIKWPASFDGSTLIGEWLADNVHEIALTEDGLEVTQISQMLTNMSFASPMDFAFSPYDGALYMLEWGQGFGDGGSSSQVVRIEYHGPTDMPPPDNGGTDPTLPEIPEGDLVCVGDVGDEVFSSDFDEGDVDGWQSASGTEQVSASDDEARSGTHSLLTSNRNQFYMGPERNLTDAVTPGETYQLTSWLRVPEGGNAADLYFVAITEEGGDMEFEAIGDAVTVTDGDWVELTATWPLSLDATSAAIKVEGTPANQSFYLDDFAVHEYEPAEALGPDDEFDGDELDGCRWDRVVRYDPDAIEMTGGQLLIDTPEGDIYQTPNDPVTNFILQNQPGDNWTVETKFTEELVSGYSQAGLMVYFDDDNYVKWDAVADVNQTGVNRLELRSEVDGQITQPEPTIDAPDNDGEWWLRLTKEGNSFTGAVSVDGENWQTTSQPVVNDLAAQVGGVGIFTLAVQDPSTTVAFDYFRVIDVYDDEDDETPPPAGDLVCLGAMSDDFAGDTLNTDRWSQIIREDVDGYSIGDGSLTVDVTATDIYGDNNTDTPNIITQPLPDGPFEATLQFTMEAYQQWQQAGLIIYGDDDNYAKMVLQGRTPNPDPAARIFQFIREENGQPNEVGDSNTGDLGADFPDTVWVRFSSDDGDSLNASYSADGVDFVDMPETKQLAGIDNPSIGMLAVAGTGQPETTVDFEQFTFTPDDTDGAVDPSDEFDGDVLDGCRWDRVVRYDPEFVELADGWLVVEAQPGDIYMGDNSDVPNFILQNQPEEDWTVETRLTEELVSGFSQAGLMVHADDDNYVKFVVIADEGQTGVNRIELRSEVDAQIVQPEPDITAPDNEGEWWLRLTKQGDSFTGEVSADGVNWTSAGEAVTNEAAAATGGVGLMAIANQDDPSTVAFDYFRVNPDIDDPDPELTVEAALDPADPDGLEDWYVSPVTLTLTSNNPEALLQWRATGDDSWIAWTEPVTIETDGIHELEYRAYIEGNDPDDGNGDNGDGDVSDAVDVQVGGITDGPADSFAPDVFTIAQGGTITYTHGGGFHNVVIVDDQGQELDRSGSATGSWDEPYLFEADQTGTFYFYCTPHVAIDDTDDPSTWTGMVGSFDVVTSNGNDGDNGNSNGGGNEEQESQIGSLTVQLDQTAPETSVQVAGDQSGDAYLDEATVSLEAADATSGVASTEYRINGGDEQVYDGPFAISGDGLYILEYRSTDVAGNAEEWQAVPVDIVEEDDAPPVIGPPVPTRPVCDRHQGGATFPDSPGSGHRSFIDCLAELGVVQGYTDGTYGPANDVSREQLATYVVNAIELATGETLEAGGELFPDVGVNSTHGEAVYKLRNAGIIQGYEDGTFRPRESVSRDQTARYIVNTLESLLGYELPAMGVRFPDVAHDEYVADIDKLATGRIIRGFPDGTYRPREPVTRGQMARFIAGGIEVLASEHIYEGP